MRYSIEPRERRYVKGYGFLSFARNIGTHAAKVAKHMSNKYSQKLVDTAKKSATDAIKTTSKRVIQVHQKSNIMKKEIQSNEVNNEIPKERYISPKERKQIIDGLRLI